MYGLIGQMLSVPGKREELIAALRENEGGMPGCLSYVIARDTENPDAIWVSEVWDSAESHRASLELESVKAAITRARPVIAGFGQRIETEPVGGIGLAQS